MSEWQLIESIKKSATVQSPYVIVGPEDDCALLASHPKEQLVAVDTILEGVHFDSQTTDPVQIGRKALAVNLSDIAAMGGVAETCFVALTLSQSKSLDFAQGVMRGMADIAATFGVALAGGDTTAWPGGTAISVTVTGRPHANGIIRRSGAKNGDFIFVTGELGGSLESHHHSFIPRLTFAKDLLDLLQPTSMIDLSDGLSTDLKHILVAAQMDATLYTDALPYRQNISHLPPDKRLERMLCDGEDFELCFTVKPEDLQKLNPLKKQKTRLTCIGQVQPSENLQQPGKLWNQAQDELKFHGYEHQF